MTRRDKLKAGPDDALRIRRRALAARRIAENRLREWGDGRFWRWLKKSERKVSKAIAHLRRHKQSPKVSRLIAAQQERAQWFSLVREEAERLRPSRPGVPSDRVLRRRRVGLYARERQAYRPPE
jgi:hypothetical protein